MCTYLSWTCVVFSVYNTVISSGYNYLSLQVLSVLWFLAFKYHICFVLDLLRFCRRHLISGKKSFVVGVDQRRFSFHLLFVQHFHMQLLAWKPSSFHHISIHRWISTPKEIEKRSWRKKQWIVRQKKRGKRTMVAKKDACNSYLCFDE